MEARSDRTFCIHLAIRPHTTEVAVPLTVAVALQRHPRHPQLCVRSREDELAKLVVSGGGQPHVQVVQPQLAPHPHQLFISEEEALSGQQVTEGGVAGGGGEGRRHITTVALHAC